MSNQMCFYMFSDPLFKTYVFLHVSGPSFSMDRELFKTYAFLHESVQMRVLCVRGALLATGPDVLGHDFLTFFG